jgi:hypothetical protein
VPITFDSKNSGYQQLEPEENTSSHFRIESDYHSPTSVGSTSRPNAAYSTFLESASDDIVPIGHAGEAFEFGKQDPELRKAVDQAVVAGWQDIRYAPGSPGQCTAEEACKILTSLEAMRGTPEFEVLTPGISPFRTLTDQGYEALNRFIREIPQRTDTGQVRDNPLICALRLGQAIVDALGNDIQRKPAGLDAVVISACELLRPSDASQPLPETKQKRSLWGELRHACWREVSQSLQPWQALDRALSAPVRWAYTIPRNLLKDDKTANQARVLLKDIIAKMTPGRHLGDEAFGRCVDVLTNSGQPDSARNADLLQELARVATPAQLQLLPASPSGSASSSSSVVSTDLEQLEVRQEVDALTVKTWEKVKSRGLLPDKIAIEFLGKFEALHGKQPLDNPDGASTSLGAKKALPVVERFIGDIAQRSDNGYVRDNPQICALQLANSLCWTTIVYSRPRQGAIDALASATCTLLRPTDGSPPLPETKHKRDFVGEVMQASKRTDARTHNWFAYGYHKLTLPLERPIDITRHFLQEDKTANLARVMLKNIIAMTRGDEHLSDLAFDRCADVLVNSGERNSARNADLLSELKRVATPEQKVRLKQLRNGISATSGTDAAR